MDARTGASPAQTTGDSYFSTRTKSNLSKAESTSKSSMSRSRSGSKDSPPLEKRLVRQPSGRMAPQEGTPRPDAHAREAASEGRASRKGSLADEEPAGVPEARAMKTPEANQSRHTLLHTSSGAWEGRGGGSAPPTPCRTLYVMYGDAMPFAAGGGGHAPGQREGVAGGAKAASDSL
ncbi:predicted protein [Verticillium alfalfae VaMs.102]|uniref:Predicted protein n=1 Tax=Verticillium alfalfae (strain VaMs.102 / ATCC MYA-4576 / FGSC 10136) TaxID=526221 RepID=C9SCS3_VERA1|nr:predicted protein [Verticillium alfalfae VaMs.102]EEY16888.1 predicted protein [Verticillium alfalfae VaMs.102]